MNRLSIFLLLMTACGSVVPPPTPHPAANPVSSIATPLAIAFDSDGSHLLLAERAADGRCSLLRIGAGNKREPFVGLSFCPTALFRLEGGGLVAAGGGRTAWIDAAGKVTEVAGEVEAVRSQDEFVIRLETGTFWARGSERVSVPVRMARIAADGTFLVGVVRDENRERVVRINRDQSRVDLTAWFAAIDSLDLSPDGEEVVFSAKLPTGFDVGLVSSTGSAIHWIIPDPADERDVSWAPRGHKIGYLITVPGGSLFRTVHIPTGASLTTDLGGEEARGLVWDPRAERVAILSEAPSRSAEVEMFNYGGKERHIVSPPERSVAIEVQTFAPHTIVIPPMPVRYRNRYPLVIWLGEGHPYRWSETRVELAEGGAAGTIVTSLDAGDLPDGFWTAVDGLPWVDRNRIYVVSMQPVRSPAGLALAAEIVAPTGSDPGPKVVVVAPDDVESTALRLLKPLVKPSPTNGLP